MHGKEDLGFQCEVPCGILSPDSSRVHKIMQHMSLAVRACVGPWSDH